MILSGAFVDSSSDTSSAIGITLLVVHILIFALFAYVSIRRLILTCCKKRPQHGDHTNASNVNDSIGSNGNGFSNGVSSSTSSVDVEMNNMTTSSHGHMLSSSQVPSD
jgi:hypothetical protein